MHTTKPSATKVVWDLPTRLFHWLFAALIVFAYVSAEEDSGINQWHMAAGYSVMVLLAFRIVWGFAGGEYARFTSFLKLGHLPQHISQMMRFRVERTIGHNPLGGIAVVLMLGLAAATVFTGALLKGEEPHEDLGEAMIILAGIHVAAVFAMSVMTRENLPRAMVTGRKDVEEVPAGRAPRRASFVGWATGISAIVIATVAILRYDPLAFTPRSTESAEGRGEHQGERGEYEREYEVEH